MPQIVLEIEPIDAYTERMEARVAVLERLADQAEASARKFRAEMREMRAEMHAGFDSLRTDMQAGFADVRHVHERDFRIMFGALVMAAIGLAGLVARSAHWL